MGNSGKPISSDALEARVAGALAAVVFPGAHVLAGFSGGVDSTVLLLILSRLASRLQFSLRAIHVHHGISPHADEWATFCAAFCARLGVRLETERIAIGPWRGLGLEGAARAARYDAFARHEGDLLLLAQHRDDQAETLLLQLLRGAGALGLAGMAAVRSDKTGSIRIVRPFLETPRAEIEAYARANRLEWIDDPSNADDALQRNFLRHRVLPILEERYPHARAVIARSAANLREAAAILDETGDADFAAAGGVEGLDISALRGLGRARGKNVLRVYCRAVGCPLPGGALLEEVWAQVTTARSDASPRLDVGDWAFRRYRNRLHLDRLRALPEEGLRVSWNGENALPLLEYGGVLRFRPEEGRGISTARLAEAPVTIRQRDGGEKLQLHAGGPHRTLKNLFQERGIPPWRRTALPLVFCGDELIAVPGIGEAAQWRAARGERGLIVLWESL